MGEITSIGDHDAGFDLQIDGIKLDTIFLPLLQPKNIIRWYTIHNERKTGELLTKNIAGVNRILSQT